MIDYQSWVDEYTEELHKVERALDRLRAKIKTTPNSSRERSTLMRVIIELGRIRREHLDTIGILSQRI